MTIAADKIPAHGPEARLQTLYVRLLFCERTLAALRDDPDGLLDRNGLSPDDAELLPDPDDANFLVEVRGRRALVRRQIEARFPRTFHLAGQSDGDASPVRPLIDVGDFLSSEHFFDPAMGLPHPAGVGPGYECISKFFFWLRETRGLACPGADLELRAAAYFDFAAYLIEQVNAPSHEFFERFTGGVCWPRAPDATAPLVLVSDKLQVFAVRDAAKIAKIRKIGIADLDAVAPVAWTLEDNI